MNSVCFFLLFVSLVPLCFLRVSSNGDAEILIRVKMARLHDPDGKLHDWVLAGEQGSSPCNWTGISCDQANVSVTKIDISGFGLSGEFPYGFCRIQTLRNLTLTDNYLNGTFVSESLSLCSHLHVLILNSNSFSGTLPEFSPNFCRLRVLELESNEFSGEIPESYGRFPELRVLNLNGNTLSGTVPEFLGNLTDLTRLELSFIPFSPGPIPSSIGNLTKLTYLRFTNSRLVGEIPEWIGNLVSLRNLDLATNDLSGVIPDSIGRLSSIYQIELFENQLSGELPESIGNLTALRNLDVSENNLTGKLPEKIAALQLSSFNLNDNFFTGEIPEVLAFNPNLVQFKIFNNSFTGTLPTSLGRFSDLEEIDVSTNNFTGELPPFLCYRKKLRRVIIFNNQFTGKLPESYGDCPSLYYVRMDNNNLSGEIPAKFWELPLFRLELSDNRFEGTVPPSISSARHLSQLDLSGNKFSGPIPAKICDLRDLARIDLSRNGFFGILPPCITGLKKLERVNVQENHLDGEIPSSVSTWTQLTELNLSNNRFRGMIPPQLGDLPVLTYLDLSNNEISGEIPAELSRLRLCQFNVSNNRLHGRIPTGFQQEIFISSFLGNPNLCGPDLSPIPRCRSKPQTPYIIAIAATCVVIVTCSLAWLFIKISPLFPRKPNRAFKVTTFQRVGFTELDIFPHLTKENIIGAGGSGLVYRVVLESDQTLAVKKLWGEPGRKPESESVFRTEIETLGRVRHGNIVKLLMCCSGEEFRILVYEFMENGSLGDVLHSEKGRRAVSSPDWTTRFSIAVGAAQGLAYLHHDCMPAIVHRDVKSNNILLDSEMVPRVADFGLAKPLEAKTNSNATMSQSNIAGSYGYIAPEYAYTLKVNEKSDVYSFGVVLLELVTGKRPNDPSFGENKDIVKFAMEAALSYSSSSSPVETSCDSLGHFGDVSKLIDSRMKPSASDSKEIEKVVDVALLCTSSFPINRPTMRRVVELLKEKPPPSVK